jgi:hypothetical protein
MTKREIKQLAKRIGYSEEEIMEDQEYFYKEYPAHIEDAKRYVTYTDLANEFRKLIPEYYLNLFNLTLKEMQTISFKNIAILTAILLPFALFMMALGAILYSKFI